MSTKSDAPTDILKRVWDQAGIHAGLLGLLRALDDGGFKQPKVGLNQSGCLELRWKSRSSRPDPGYGIRVAVKSDGYEISDYWTTSVTTDPVSAVKILEDDGCPKKKSK